MKKALFFLVLVTVLCLSFFTITNTIDKSIKKIPEHAVLL